MRDSARHFFRGDVLAAFPRNYDDREPTDEPGKLSGGGKGFALSSSLGLLSHPFAQESLPVPSSFSASAARSISKAKLPQRRLARRFHSGPVTR